MYSWNFDKDAEYWDNGTFDTIEECISDVRNGLDLEIFEGEDVVYIGECVDFEPYVNAEEILDTLEVCAYDEFGEFAEDWRTYSHVEDEEALNELSEQLTNIIKDWLKKHSREPHFFRIESITPYNIKTAEPNPAE